MTLQPLTNMITSLFSSHDTQILAQTGLVPIKGTSFKIDLYLYAKVLQAKDNLGAEYEAEHIKRQLETHSAVTTIEQ